MTGEAPQRYGNAHPTIVPYQTFETSDGSIALGVGNDGQWQRLVQSIGAPDLINDPRFRTNPDRVHNRSKLQSILAEIFRSRPTAEWVNLIRAANVPISAVRSVAEVLNDEQVAAREMVLSVKHPTIGEVRLLGIPYKFSETRASVRRYPPLLGEHTEELRQEFG